MPEQMGVGWGPGFGYRGRGGMEDVRLHGSGYSLPKDELDLDDEEELYSNDRRVRNRLGGRPTTYSNNPWNNGRQGLGHGFGGGCPGFPGGYNNAYGHRFVDNRQFGSY